MAQGLKPEIHEIEILWAAQSLRRGPSRRWAWLP
jgi:hypothetical protein